MAGTITSANSILLLSIAGLFDTAQQIQGFAADDAFSTDSIEPSESVMGVDGRASFGWVPVLIKQNYMLQADSGSIAIFENWYNANQTIRDVYLANGSILLKSTGQKYAMTRGTLSGYVPTAAAKKVLQSRTFSITWENITSAPF